MMIKLAEHIMPRGKAILYSIIGGVVIGLYSSMYSPVDLTSNASLFLWFPVAFTLIIILHETVHCIVALLFGYRPFIGHKFPAVYVTFKEKIPRKQFMITAIAPFIILNGALGFLFAGGLFKIFCLMCLVLNTIGSVGDLWLTFKLCSHESGTIVQDLKTGIEVYK
jgi:hypothetical protein